MKWYEVLYLNIYPIVLLVAAVVTVVFPLWSVCLWFLIVQAIVFLVLVRESFRLFGTYPQKVRMISLLLRRNRTVFHPASFVPYLDAPCSRSVVRVVLQRLDLSWRYADLLKLRKPFGDRIRESCRTQETKITFYGESENA